MSVIVAAGKVAKESYLSGNSYQSPGSRQANFSLDTGDLWRTSWGQLLSSSCLQPRRGNPYSLGSGRSVTYLCELGRVRECGKKKVPVLAKEVVTTQLQPAREWGSGCQRAYFLRKAGSLFETLLSNVPN